MTITWWILAIWFGIGAFDALAVLKKGTWKHVVITFLIGPIGFVYAFYGVCKYVYEYRLTHK